MTALVSVYATFRDAAEADRIGRRLVEERLAACVNILGGCRSIYRWQGKVEQADEVAAIFKCRATGAQALIARLADLHSYEVPAAVAWPIDAALPAYAAWVEEESRG